MLILFLLLTNAFALTTSGPALADAVEPYVTHLRLKPEDLRALADRLVVARALPSDNDKEMAAIGAVLADATPGAFVESYKTLATFGRTLTSSLLASSAISPHFPTSTG
jgi:hypothetical protein